MLQTSFFKNRITRLLVAILSITMLIIFFIPKETWAQAHTPPGLAKVPRRTIFWGQNGISGNMAKLLANAIEFSQNDQACPPILASSICNLYRQLYDPNEFPPKIYLQNMNTGVLLPPFVWENLIAASLELVRQRQETQSRPIVLILNELIAKRVVKEDRAITIALEYTPAGGPEGTRGEPIELRLFEVSLVRAVPAKLLTSEKPPPGEEAATAPEGELSVLIAQVLTDADPPFPFEPTTLAEPVQPTLITSPNSDGTITLTYDTQTPEGGCQAGSCLGGCTIESSDRQKMDVCGSGSLTIWPPSNTTTYTWDCQ